MTASATVQDAPGRTQDPSMDGAYRVHGGQHPNAAALLDLSVNVSPLAPAPSVLDAVRGADLTRYPDPRATRAREAVAARFGTRPEATLVGHGAAELLWLTCQALLPSTGAHVLLGSPTFSEWQAAAAAQGAKLHHVPFEQARDFAWDPGAFDRALGRVAPAMAYLCTPNNPTGVGVDSADVHWLAARHPRVLFVVDQAFLGLSPRAAELACLPPENALLVRSLTKDHGLPGLRVGYALAAPALIDRLERVRPAWSTSAPVQAAVVAAMAADGHEEAVREHMLVGANRTRALLQWHGFGCVSGEAPFVLAELPYRAARFAHQLAELGVLVRDCTSFGLPFHVRIAGVGESDAPRLDRALRQVPSSAANKISEKPR